MEKSSICDLMKEKKDYYKEYKRYRRAYNILMENWHEFTGESQTDMDKKLRKVGL